MPYLTTETVGRVAAQVLTESGLTVDARSAALRLSRDSLRDRLAPIPDEPAAKPVVILDIFLSHSSLDQLQVLGIYRLLRQRGYAVYLDQVCDPLLNRANVTRATARVLRYRMAQSRSLFVATSDKTTHSKWVPWELGFTDGWNAKAAILPIVPRGTVSFQRQEYFELYPEIRDAGSGHVRPNDLDIWEGGSFVGSWGRWLTMPRSF